MSRDGQGSTCCDATGRSVASSKRRATLQTSRRELMVAVNRGIGFVQNMQNIRAAQTDAETETDDIAASPVPALQGHHTGR